LVERALSTYRERFATTGLYENALYPSIVEMLEGSRRLATRIFVVTSKPAIYANRIIQHFRLEGYFSGVYGPDLDGRLDDKRDLLAHVLESARITGASVMVGDRAVDILAARANAVHAIGALWGYGSAPELVEAGADRLCPHPLALEGCLEELASQ
jgi:phosphoglycolate phosphatase